MRYTIIVFAFLCLPFFLFAQKAPKYGKILDHEIEIQTTEIDPDANAIILTDYGQINFKGDEVAFLRHKRIKLLNKNSYEEANISIPFYAADKSERITKIKAQTINIDEKGKLKKKSIKKNQFFVVDINEYWKEIRFTFPDIKPGSIIEFEYVKSSDRILSLEEWQFRNNLPTLRSQLAVIITKGLDYKSILQGDKLIEKYGSGDIRNYWELRDLEPIKDEPYCINPFDYVESIQFQLAGYNRPSNFSGMQSTYVPVLPSWEEFAREILNDESYEGVLKGDEVAEKIIQTILAEGDTDREKVKKIYAYVQNNINWNNKFSHFPNETFEKITKSREGNSAEVNLVLVKLLQVAGFNANPMIISTKEHGLVTQVYPLFSQFNHVLAQVKLYGKDMLMDAVSKYRPYNILARNDLNPLGYLLSRNDARWIIVPLPNKTRSVINTDLKFEEDQIKYKTSFSFYEHEAVSNRIKLFGAENEKDFITNYLLDVDEEEEMTLDSFSIQNSDLLEKPLKVVCYYSKEMEGALGDDILYINPFQNKHYDKNPFIKPTRYLPVDFILPSSEKFILNLYLPENYEVDDMPSDSKLSTESKKMNYSFLFNDPIPGRVQLVSELKIVDPFIKPNEYSTLRKMFEEIMGLQETQLVLKKK